MPSFWLGIMLILIVSGYFNWLPSSGRSTYGVAPGDSGFYIIQSLLSGNMKAAWDGIKYIIMPAIALGTGMMGLVMRVTRSSVLEIMSEDYVRTARAKGLGERTVLWRHVLRNALVPVITVVGLELGTLLSGSIIVETVFAWPGSGSLLISAIQSRDYPLITGTVLTYTIAFVVINFAIDILYAWSIRGSALAIARPSQPDVVGERAPARSRRLRAAIRPWLTPKVIAGGTIVLILIVVGLLGALDRALRPQCAEPFACVAAAGRVVVRTLLAPTRSGETSCRDCSTAPVSRW